MLTALLTAGCGSSPPDSSATGGQSSTGTATSDLTTSGDSPTTQSSNSDSDPVTDSGMSAGQTEATTGTDTGTMTAGVTSTDTTTTTSPVTSDTETTTDPGTSDTTTTGTTGPDTTSTDTSTTSGTSTGDTGDTTTGDTTTDGTTGEALECSLQLKATIRDFKLPHPDFETYCCGVVPGLVKPDLGPDKKPVFNQPGNPKMLTDAPTFDQWYNNVKDINQSTQIVLDLQEIMPGVYSYQNNSFFPIDNQLFGNQGNNHNFHFTTVPDTS